MNVSLTPELESLINNKVKTGLYNSASEVVREALRLLEEKDRLSKRRGELIEEIARGTDQIRNGKGIEITSREASRSFAKSVIQRGREKIKTKPITK